MAQQEHRAGDSHFPKWVENSTPLEDNLEIVQLSLARARATEEAGAAIARQLNREKVSNHHGRPWTPDMIHTILRNENYVGNLVHNRRSRRLGQTQICNPDHLWVRREGIIEPIVEPASAKGGQSHPAIVEHAPKPVPGAAPHHVFLIDGSGFIFRAYHALPPLSRSDGTPTSAVLGFSNMLAKLLSETDADHIAVVFDASGRSFRNRIYDQYKAQRPDPAPDLIPQFALVRRATAAFGVCQIELDEFEADDLIATYARHAVSAGAKVTIVSSDKDLMQLVTDKVTMLDPIKNRPIGAAEVRERFGVGPERVIDVQALSGDSVDNVPGVPGIGVKTAAELINTYGDLETLLARAAEIKQPKRRQSLIENEKQARLSKELVKLDDDAPLPCPLSALVVKPLDPETLLPFLREMEFRALATRMTQRLSGIAPATPPERLTGEDFDQLDILFRRE